MADHRSAARSGGAPSRALGGQWRTEPHGRWPPRSPRGRRPISVSATVARPGAPPARAGPCRWARSSHARARIVPSAGWCRSKAGERRVRRSELVAFGLLLQQLAVAADGFRPLARAALGRLLVVPAHAHLAIEALALHLLLERAERLVDVVVANLDLDQGALSLRLPDARDVNDRALPGERVVQR